MITLDTVATVVIRVRTIATSSDNHGRHDPKTSVPALTIIAVIMITARIIRRTIIVINTSSKNGQNNPDPRCVVSEPWAVQLHGLGSSPKADQDLQESGSPTKDLFDLRDLRMVNCSVADHGVV